MRYVETKVTQYIVELQAKNAHSTRFLFYELLKNPSGKLSRQLDTYRTSDKSLQIEALMLSQ